MRLSVCMQTLLVAGLHLTVAYNIKVELQARRTNERLKARHLRTQNEDNVPLTNYVTYSSIQWYSRIAVGTPPQYFNTLFDTGSTNLLLPRIGCSTCSGHTTFDPSLSTTFSSQPGLNVSVSFSTGATGEPLISPAPAVGTFVTDTVSVNGIAVQNQAFLLCTQFSAALNDVKLDGVFGMAPPNLSTSGVEVLAPDTAWVWKAYADGQISEPRFSLYLNTENISEATGELTLGGIDFSKIDGELHTIGLNEPLTQYSSEWVLNMSSVWVNGAKVLSPTGSPVVSNFSVMDIGTAYLQAPDFETAKAIYNSISSDIVQIDSLGAWGAPCDRMAELAPEITFTIGISYQSINVTVPKDSFNLGPYPGNDTFCQAVILHPPQPIPVPGQIWVLGSPLLAGYYTVWDGGEMQMGFANLRQGLI